MKFTCIVIVLVCRENCFEDNVYQIYFHFSRKDSKKTLTAEIIVT